MLDSIFPDGDIGEAAEIGAVDDGGVRLWVRRPGAGRARALLEVAGRLPVEGVVALSEETDWTGAIDLRLPAPAPDAAFTCAVHGRRLSGWLAPASGSHSGLVFGFGSCHMPFALQPDGRVGLHAGAGMYPAMAAELRRAGARRLLLIGDQIYGDHLRPTSVFATLPPDRRTPPSLDDAVAAYRRVYRGFFGEAGFRAVREALPTCVMWDDHEILNDWGSLLEDGAYERRLFEAAARAYCEYQHQRNPGAGIGPPPYQYSFRCGDIGFLALDLRGRRDFESGRHLGAAQWAEVHAWLAGEEAGTVTTLFVVAAVPVAHASRWFVELLQRLPGDRAAAVRDRWCSAAFVEERDELLGALFDWQAVAPGRQVILLSGDIHCAEASTIRLRGRRGVMQQFTSSALTTPLSRKQATLNRIAMTAPSLLEPHLRVRHHFLISAHNYGLVRVTPLDRGHRVEFTVRAWRPRDRMLMPAGRIVCAPARGDRG